MPWLTIMAFLKDYEAQQRLGVEAFRSLHLNYVIPIILLVGVTYLFCYATVLMFRSKPSTLRELLVLSVLINLILISNICLNLYRYTGKCDRAIRMIKNNQNACERWWAEDNSLPSDVAMSMVCAGAFIE